MLPQSPSPPRDNQGDQQADPWAALCWGSCTSGTRSPSSGRPLRKCCSLTRSDHELEEVLYQNFLHAVWSPPRSPSTATHSTRWSSLHTSIVSAQMMLLLPKTWTTVSPKPAALLVASSTEGSGGTSLGPVKKVVISTLLYAAETWVLYRKHIQLLERFHQSFLWSIMGIHWQDYVTNDEALKRAELPSIETMLLHQHLYWVGYVSRMNDTQSCGLWQTKQR